MIVAAHNIIGVIDIGKTNAKFAVVDGQLRKELAVRTMPNTVLNSGPYPHFDIEGIWDFIKRSIKELNLEYKIEAISITTHGACAALVAGNGNLALPVLDYEHDGPEKLAEGYASVRPDFSSSFSPLLPVGLNLGAQLYWQQKTFPDEFERTRWIMSYPQYWGYRLSGVAAAEITSIGCHTDMWDFRSDEYSSLVKTCGWVEKMPPMCRANEVLGSILPSLEKEFRLDGDIPVYCGIHDSNASLLPHLLEREAPFSVVSTGTWVIVCSPGGDLTKLDETRDCLANIDVFGHSVPSARFMGGREFSSLLGNEISEPAASDVKRVLHDEIMLFPSVESGTGPFAHEVQQWSHSKDSLSAEILYVVVSFYLAMVTAECLELSDGHGDIIVEGPFARNIHYLMMLSSATKTRVCANATSATGTSIGAAALVMMGDEGSQQRDHDAGTFLFCDKDEYQEYAKKWRFKNSHRNAIHPL